MKNKILISGIFIMVFLGMTFFLNQKFKSDIHKKEDEIRKTEAKKEELEKEQAKPYKDNYLNLVKANNGTGVVVEEDVYQYVSINQKNHVAADFILTSHGDLYLGFPNYDAILPEEIMNSLEPFEFLNYVTLTDEENQYHTFFGQKIKENIESIYYVNVKEDAGTYLAFIYNDHHMGFIDLTEVNSSNIRIVDLPYENIISVLQSKNQNGFEVFALQNNTNRINISENFVKAE